MNRSHRCLAQLLAITLVFFARGFAACPEIESDSHYRLLYENSAARVFKLELPRLESTSNHCHEHPFFYVAVTDGETTDTLDGHAGIARKWQIGVSRFVAGPETHVVRNDGGTPFREVVVEILSPLEYNPFRGNYDEDDFPAGVPQVAVTTSTVSVQHGAMSAIRAQVVGGDKIRVPGSTKVLLALTDGKLSGNGQDFDLKRGDIKPISADSEFDLTNTGRLPIRFVTISF
jgi:hypothetical protein